MMNRHAFVLLFVCMVGGWVEELLECRGGRECNSTNRIAVRPMLS